MQVYIVYQHDKWMELWGTKDRVNLIRKAHYLRTLWKRAHVLVKCPNYL